MVNILLTSESRYPVNRKGVKQAVIDILKEQKIKSAVEVSVLIVGDRKMAELNKKYLNHEGTTDVLSFPLGNGLSQTRNDLIAGFVNPPDEVLRLGDIVVSYPCAVKQAQEFNLLVDQEISNLVKHGVLHLLGIHHGE